MSSLSKLQQIESVWEGVQSSASVEKRHYLGGRAHLTNEGRRRSSTLHGSLLLTKNFDFGGDKDSLSLNPESPDKGSDV